MKSLRAFTYALSSLRLGTSNAGQLGRPENPGAEEIMTNVITGSCGFLHTLVVKDDGTVFSCGKAAGGRLGNGNDMDDCYEPHPSFKLADLPLRALSSGSMHNALITASGQLLAWGYDSVSIYICLLTGSNIHIASRLTQLFYSTVKWGLWDSQKMPHQESFIDLNPSI